MFSLICVWINDWVNNREAGDLRRYRAHSDVIVMPTLFNTYEMPPLSYKGQVPYCDSNDNKSTMVSLSSILFSFMKNIVCNKYGLRSPSFESSDVLYITPSYTSSIQELILQGMQQNQKNPAFGAKRTLGMSDLIIFYSIWPLLSMGLDT